MVFGIFDYFKKESENINYEILITTLFFIIIGILYFIHRLRRFGNTLTETENNDANYSNINNNNNHENIHNQNNIKTINIIIQLERNRYNFTIKLTDNIGQFVREKIYPLTNNKDVYLFFQGQLLNQTQNFSFYEHRLSENMVIIGKIRENNNARNLNTNHYNDNINERLQEQMRNDPQSVSIYTLITHCVIIITLGFIIFSYKTFKEIFTTQTVRTIQLLTIFWAFYFSNAVTKLIYYRKISF